LNIDHNIFTEEATNVNTTEKNHSPKQNIERDRFLKTANNTNTKITRPPQCSIVPDEVCSPTVIAQKKDVDLKKKVRTVPVNKSASKYYITNHDIYYKFF